MNPESVMAWVVGVGLALALLSMSLGITATLLLKARASVAASEAARVRARLAARKRSKQSSDDDGDDGEGLPPWLRGIAEGAGVDVDRLMSGDPREAAKAQALLQGVAQQQAGEQTGGDLLA